MDELWEQMKKKKTKRKEKKRKIKWLLHHALDIQMSSDKTNSEMENQDQNFWKLVLKRNALQAMWLYLRWQIAFFHYPFVGLENYL